MWKFRVDAPLTKSRRDYSYRPHEQKQPMPTGGKIRTYLNFEFAIEHGLEAIVCDELEVEIEVLRQEDPVRLRVTQQDLSFLDGISDHVTLWESIVHEYRVYSTLVHGALPV